MTTQPLRTIIHHQADMAIIELYGEINALAGEGLNAAFNLAQSCHPERVLLNFAGVTYINSPGLGLILGLLGQARQRVISCGLSAHYKEIFAITGLTKLMPIIPNEIQPGHTEDSRKGRHGYNEAQQETNNPGNFSDRDIKRLATTRRLVQYPPG